jgi:hypothetical protein
MSDLAFQDLSTVQSDKQPNPPTIASAATISPKTFIAYTTITNRPILLFYDPVTALYYPMAIS